MLFYHITSTVTPKDHEKRHTGPRTAEPSRSRTVFARAFKTNISTSALATITTTTAIARLLLIIGTDDSLACFCHEPYYYVFSMKPHRLKK